MNKRLTYTNIFLLVMLGLYLFANLYVSVVIMVYPDMPQQVVWMNTATYLIGFGLPCVVYAFILKNSFRQPLRETFSFRKLPFSTVLLSILLGLLIQPVNSLIAQLASLVFQDITSLSVTSMTGMPLLYLIFAMAVLPAVFEEILCRGVLFDGHKDAPVWYQLVIPGVFFGLLHMNFQQISYALPMGIFLGYVLYITGSIYSTMIIHFVMNGSQVTIAWLYENLGWFDGSTLFDKIFLTCMGSSDLLWVNACAAGVAAALIVLILLALRKIHCHRQKPPRILRPGWHKGAYIMYIILGLFFLLALLMEAAIPLLQPYM
ncbi:MAG: CPBP family intramembrane metalloprotease [Lachnospiraceae bacterium]|nr:CPBP family intramembrane metalloprotease [Lachnospiraceae bacterium]